MSWDGIYRRSVDAGKDPPDVLLARIDENLKFLKTGAEVVRLQLIEHEKKDDVKFDDIGKKFDSINKSIWMVSGGACVLIFLMKIFIH